MLFTLVRNFKNLATAFVASALMRAASALLVTPGSCAHSKERRDESRRGTHECVLRKPRGAPAEVMWPRSTPECW